MADLWVVRMADVTAACLALMMVGMSAAWMVVSMAVKLVSKKVVWLAANLVVNLVERWVVYWVDEMVEM